MADIVDNLQFPETPENCRGFRRKYVKTLRKSLYTYLYSMWNTDNDEKEIHNTEVKNESHDIVAEQRELLFVCIPNEG